MRKNLFNYTVFLTVLLLLINWNASGQGINTSGCGCDHIIQPNEMYIDGGTLGAGPGDVVCVVASSKRYLGFINFHGAPGNPIVFINCGGQVIVQNTDWYYGIKFDNCSYFQFTGTGSPTHQYGFLVDGTPDLIAGVGIARMSTDFEIDHIEVSRTGFAGIIAKSDPDCTGQPNRGNFTQRNTIIHDNYIHNTRGEGIYIGFPHYRGIKRACDGADSMWVLPHDIVGLKIFKNRIANTGKEGLQVGCATSDVTIYDNTIQNFGENNSQYQRAGVHLSTGTTGKFYRNIIANGTGPGIWLNAMGDNYIFNNVISNTGEDGMMIHDSLVADGKPYNIINNTIVNTNGNGMKVYTNRSTILNFCNNIIAGSGGELMSVPGGVAFNNLNNVVDHNVFNLAFEDFASGNYHLRAISPAVDGGSDMAAYGVVVDYDFIGRPRGKAYDAGAFESPYERLIIGFFIYPNPIYTVAYIRFVLPEDSDVKLRVRDVHGRIVAIIAQGRFEGAKEYNFEFDSFFLAQGIYYYTLEANDEIQVKKILMVE